MRRPRMSTGAWIFTGLVCAAVIAPATVYAATITKVALSGSNGTNVATVTAQHQLLTAAIPPSQVVRVVKTVSTGCTSVYTPPAGKAIVVTSVVYNFGNGTDGSEQFGGLLNRCSAPASVYDQIDEVQKFGSLQHTFPTGVPMPSIAMTDSGPGSISVFVYGYLIDSNALPANASARVSNAVKGLSPGR